MLKRAILIISTVILGLMLTDSSFAQEKTIVKRKAKTQDYVLKDVIITSYRKNNSRKSKSKRNFSSQTQPFADGLRKKGSSTKRKSSQKRVTMQDGVLFPAYRSKSPRKH